MDVKVKKRGLPTGETENLLLQVKHEAPTSEGINHAGSTRTQKQVKSQAGIHTLSLPGVFTRIQTPTAARELCPNWVDFMNHHSLLTRPMRYSEPPV